MEKEIKDNEFKIERFDSEFYLKQKNYAMASAIRALETTNEIQKAYFKKQANLCTEDYILRLYALLQGLFVSIDSLYSLAYSLTKSKNFININNNKNLRELKYIRNDVVGHPSSRTLKNEISAYCILDNSSISISGFSYYIYTRDEIKKKDIVIKDILMSYYQEANALLDELYSLAYTDKNKTKLESAISFVVDDFFMNRDYIASLNHFFDVYMQLYPTAKKEQHRILWRKDLILHLKNYQTKNLDEAAVIEYCIGLELIKMYKLIYQVEYKMDLMKRTPTYIAAFYRFLNKNKHLYGHLNYLSDSDHPLFLNSIIKLRDEALKKKVTGAVRYLNMIIDSYEEKKLDFVYALALPIKEYRKK